MASGPVERDRRPVVVDRGRRGDADAVRYHLGTMPTDREPVSRRLAAGLGSAFSVVASAPSNVLRRAPVRESHRAIEARRLAALQALATELAGALTTAQITELLMARGIAALRADGAAVFLIEPGEAALTAIAWRGHADARARSMARLPIDLPLPATDVARTGDPVFIEDPSTYLDRYGSTFRQLGVAAQLRAVAAVPLEVDGRRFGVLGFSWNHAHPLAPDRQAFIAALARLGASAMERGRLFDAERAAPPRDE